MPPIMGFDRHRQVLAMARKNAERAGLESRISFAFQDIYDFRHDFPARGLVVTNPPYGKRLADSGELPALYGALGRLFRERLEGWRAAVLTEDQALGKNIGISASRLNSFFNGAIACKLIQFTIEETAYYRDDRLPARVPVADLPNQTTAFRNRLEKNLKQRRRWAGREDVSCYRIYDADLPDYAAAIDLYGNAAFPNEQWLCIQEYEAPDAVDATKAKLRAREMRTVAQSLFEVDDDHLFYKTRARQRGANQYERVANQRHFHEVTEGPCRLLVNFEDYLDTGLFLDHRPLRHRLFMEANGKRFLNLFAYTATATVHAALGGACLTTSVDMSRTYLEWAEKNFALNGIDTNRHHLVQADCLTWLHGHRKHRYDLILLDPPTFSNSKRMSRPFDVQKDHAELIEQTMRLLAPGGTLYFSSNLRPFRLAEGIAEKFIAKDITRQTIPWDFMRRPNIHHCWAIQLAD